MGIEENKAVVRRWLDAHEANDVEAAAAVFIPSMQEGVRRALRSVRTTFPDFHVNVLEMTAEGDKVVVNSIVSATHCGEFMGVPPTNKRLEFGAIDIYTITDGMISSTDRQADFMGMLRQMGVTFAFGGKAIP